MSDCFIKHVIVAKLTRAQPIQRGLYYDDHTLATVNHLSCCRCTKHCSCLT